MEMERKPNHCHLISADASSTQCPAFTSDQSLEAASAVDQGSSLLVKDRMVDGMDQLSGVLERSKVRA